jgi:Flp pilus assembly protein TadG
MKLTRMRARHARLRGTSLIEFALLLPLLLTLTLGVVDFGRAIQFNNIMTAMAREGANLAARTTEDSGAIIVALNATSEPLDMSANGMVYITALVGRADGTAAVQEQHRATSGNAGLASNVYSCSAWAGSACVVPAPAPIVSLSIPLLEGEVVHVAEVAYDYEPIAGFVMQSTTHLRAVAML